MKILALDSSGLVASVAVVTEDKVLGEFTVNNKKTHSQTLLPMVDEVLKILDIDVKELDAIAVAGGPGSFTGLRIGASTAKGLALVLDIPIINIPTVDSLAYNLYGTDHLICPMMDARRNQVYTGLYEWQEGEFKVVLPQFAAEVEELAEKLNSYNREIIFLGDGVEAQLSKFAPLLKAPYSIAPVHLSKQRAAALGALGVEYYKAGKLQEGDSFEPEYLRMSQAERERAEKQQQI
ncbi:tRNA (adenosine(37)-N6)-threonylcarbamoyltransferase complex dimerization subunit type 1 TsaB [Anaerocolumna chitinilytica]|uniref:tRNA (Adenosine(37)-N6)-threonylcarbamoyltransferase complex dimerization subunit type 1 TsaB n=1 Tax=Anaerocolumna chitinilytica TaxID=1727145 RepID=A0A7I8DG83_9FIRM|nr:tRNA (adenosine(37)-N6)-threonylcarbamoyltransferase complex dimerization subunit type 1 TsaB [Anaerocolumna chitinilytica]BCJ97390.1 tRNA (adenosine(37)-N6)-threonylcarbamoyltransferase complex dimerization subunit type 1 TsaB [Anaerocolumna chitinilytica]